jgi:hypothetical protein
LSNKTVELNGKRYDAVSGVFLGSSQKHPRPTKIVSISRGRHQGRSIDGFAAKSSALAPTASASLSRTAPVLSTKSTLAKGAVRSVDGFAHITNNLTPHQPARSQTLKREAVKTPHIDIKPAIKRQLPAERHASLLHHIAPKPSASRVDPQRLAHANQVSRSQHVRHFGPSRRAHAPQPVPSPQATVPQRHHALPPQPVEQSEEDMFESAIAQATSHEQKAPKRHASWKRRLANTGAIVVALIVIGIFVAYLNLPTIEINVASAQAGFHVTMPNYKALGFSFDSPVKTEGSTVSMNFTSGDSDFTLTQQASNWDNQTLMDTLATQSDVIPKTIQSEGHTIYMTHTDQATWVDGGIRYDLTGNANLNSQEITAVADSL